MNIFLEQTYNTYIPPKNTSLSMNFQSNTNKNFNKKYIPDTNLQIQYINPKQNKKDNKIINIDYIEPPFFPDFNFKLGTYFLSNCPLINILLRLLLLFEPVKKRLLL